MGRGVTAQPETEAPAIVAWLRCTLCLDRGVAAELAADEHHAALRCSRCSHRFPVRSGIADLSDGFDETSETEALAEWRRRLTRHETWWRIGRHAPRRLPQQAWRPPLEVVAAYFDVGVACGSAGRLLDVGCADGARRRHFPSAQYAGIDPLRILDSYPFPFAIARSEHLPFEDGWFKAAMAIEVLDHVLDPARVLAEMTRVVEPGGSVFVFITAGDEVDQPQWRAGFDIEESDVHLHRIGPAQLEERLTPLLDSLRIVSKDGYMAASGRRKR